MVVCAGGSHTKTGVPAAILITTDQIASVLPPTMLWLKPLLPYIKPIYLDAVTAFCAAEPPGFPDLTGIALGAVFAGGQVGASLVAAEAITQIALHYLWYAMCECISGTTPAPPAPPAAPTDLPTVNPTTVVNPGITTPCWDVTRQMFWSAMSGASMLGIVQPGGHTSIMPKPVPTRITVKLVNGTEGATQAQCSMDLQYIDSGGGILPGFTTGLLAPGATYNVTVIPPAAAASWAWTLQYSTAGIGGATPTNSVTVTITMWCAGQTPSNPNSPCCPPDPNLLGLLTRIQAQVDLIQRQSAPFGYVYGANHAGLTGHGSFAVSDLIGVSVDITAIPAHAGRIDGSPIEYFDLGFVTLGTADGYETSRRLDHEGTLMIPHQAGLFTSVGYTVPPGVTIAIRELVREP